MNHWERVALYKGKVVEIYDERRVRIVGASVPGRAHCVAVDGKAPIHECSTIFLSEENVIPEVSAP